MIINQESSIFGIERESRWAHMIIHSMLHLQGFTHDSKKTQKFMEDKERELMSSLGYSDPYYAS